MRSVFKEEVIHFIIICLGLLDLKPQFDAKELAFLCSKVKPGICKLVDSKQPGISKHLMFPKNSFPT